MRRAGPHPAWPRRHPLPRRDRRPARRGRGHGGGHWPAQPAPEFRRLHRREMGGEGGVSGIKQVMALVKDDALQAAGSCFLFACRGLSQRMVNGGGMQHQCVIGDDQRGLARGTKILFDEAALVVRAGDIDAFAAPVVRPRPCGEGWRVSPSRLLSGNSERIHEGKLLPIRSPSRECRAQRAIRAASKAPRVPPACRRPKDSCMLSRQR